MKMNNHTGRAASLPAGLGGGVCVSLSVTVLSAAVIANLIERGVVSWEKSGYGIMVTLLAASFLGAKVSWLKIKHQKLLVSILSGLLYFAVLLSVTALFFGGQYEAMGVTLALVAAGCVSAGLLGYNKNSREIKKKRKRDVVKLYK